VTTSKVSIAIALQANNKGGPQKVAALAAWDLSSKGHRVTIFVPVLPYYYYMVVLRRQPARWLKTCLPYLRDWAEKRRFSFQELVDGDETNGNVTVRFVARQASRRQLRRFDQLIVHTIAQVHEYWHSFPQDRQIYLLHHPEEYPQGFGETFVKLRRQFEGQILVVSPFTAREVASHVPNPPVVLNPISPAAWAQRHGFDPQGVRRDLVLFWKEDDSAARSSTVVKALLRNRPQTTLTIWCRGSGHRQAVQRHFPGVRTVENLTEKELCELYLSHSLLLFPSTYEGFGMPPVEALACGCIPILRPDVGAAELYARDGFNSIYLNGSADDLARRIAYVLDSPDILTSMRVNAPDSITPFNPEGYGLRLLQAAGVL
jgi:hypothetical protein